MKSSGSVDCIASYSHSDMSYSNINIVLHGWLIHGKYLHTYKCSESVEAVRRVTVDSGNSSAYIR